jgi:hypothetical protein
MNAMPTLLAKDERFTLRDAEILADYRQRCALEERERAERKRVDFAEQHAALNSADLRIRAWEKVHGLRMPSDRKHPVLQAIAAATQLTMAEVLNEQGLRSARPAPGEA